MNELQANNNMITAKPLQASLVNEFIDYVDRGEKTTRTYLTNIRQFIYWLQDNGIDSPQRSDIIAYRDYLTQGHKPNTVKQYLQSVRQFFNWAAAAGYYPNIAANVHAPKVRQDAHKKEALTAGDVLTIENSIILAAEAKAAAAENNPKDTAGRIERATEQGRRLYAMYLLAVTAGLRTVEISRANIKDVEYRNGKAFIYIWGKGHTEPDAKKPIALEVYDAIREYIDSRTDNPTGSSPLFVATGNRSGGRRLASTTISTMLKRAMQQAGYNSEKLTAHSLRHTAGRNVMELTDRNIYVTQQYMRHESPKTTEIYLDEDMTETEHEIAQQLYNKYHGITKEPGSDPQQLAAILQGMNAAQLMQLAAATQQITANT